MNIYFSRFLILMLILIVFACSDDKIVETEKPTEVSTQPKDTLDILSEAYISNAVVDSSEIIAEDLVEKGISIENEGKAVPVNEVQKTERRKKEKEAKVKSSKVPKVSFETETHSFGRIMQGEEKEFKFKFKNTGTADLQIINVTATCGCTIPSYPFIPIGPGEEGYIGVTYNSTGKLGPQKPAITVVTNAAPKTYKLYLDGIVDSERED